MDEEYVGTPDQKRKAVGTAYWLASIGAAAMIASTATLFGWVAACGVAGACLFVWGLAAALIVDCT